HVAVVHLAEDVLQVAGPAAGGVGGAPEAEPRHLEDVAKALRRDPHVVLRLHPAVERLGGERQHLVEPHLDDPGGVLAQPPLAVELLDRPGPHEAPSLAAPTSSSRLSRRAPRLWSPTIGANSRLASACSSRSCWISDDTPLRSGAGI